MTTRHIEARAEEVFRANEARLHADTDRLILRLIALEWAACVLLAAVVSPLTWTGSRAAPHPHLALALGLGTLLAAMPWYLVRTQPGRPITRHVIAIAQAGYSALLIHLTGGRIESHFHIFGSLAFLAYYRDPKVLLSASLVTVVDHVARGIYFPQSIFGVLLASPWRPIEHGAWVLFQDVFLVIAIRRSLAEMRALAVQKVELEDRSDNLEQEVAQRTSALADALERAKEADRAKSRFMANVTHELRTPLNAIIGFSHVLRDKMCTQDVGAEAVDNITEAGHLLLDLVQDVLDASGDADATEEPAQVVFDPAQVVRHVVAVAQASHPDAPVTAEVEIDADVPSRVEGPCTALARVLLGLVDNGLEYTARGRVVVHLRAEPDALVLRVTDTGPGVPDALRDAIFEPFTMVDESSARAQGGAGLGLYLARRRAARVGASLVLLHTGPDGSAFEARVPVAAAELSQPTVDVPLEPQGPPDLSRARVLVAEDNRLNQVLVQRLLERAGCTPTIVPHGQAAVDALRADPSFDCVLMDCQMPVLDGLQASLLIREELGWHKPIHALTANNSAADRAACAAARMDTFLSKPVDPEVLYATIAAGLEAPDERAAG